MLLNNKKALITGIASNRSIAYGIAKKLSENGAQLCLTYQNDNLKKRVDNVSQELQNNTLTYPCDLSSDDSIESLRKFVTEKYQKIDLIVHSAAFAPRELLSGDYLESVTREGFKVAHDVSSYSFAALAKSFKDTINQNGALLTLSYLGSERVVQNYNVMGLAKASLESNVRYMASSLGTKNIRVNAISAGPIKTLAASGITGFNEILKHVEEKAPLKRNITQEEVANAALFLLSEHSSGITGQTIYVDCGYNIVGF
ncbi:MAG: enoyl-[acyl-carrier-protein] reductase [NADH] [Gammaproteobacteria bacterium]|jgi:enoyl-[acyl-carrier protein] reductase I|nr:MAG: enoyl-[acyl-carrier-protein] reductase [NADH] [Gammaproteobacteria bacterium]|tara:strand:- start:777 stop:1547 length:771 start_codon:yes stop_codon:yes gene_type:complete